MNQQILEYDVIIVGGGMVGASLAAALKNHTDKKIAVVEACPFQSDVQPSFDDRSIALSYGSRRIFESIGLWKKLEPEIEAIKSIHVSDRGHLGATRLHHTEENVEALGYVAESKVIGRVLMNEVQNLSHVDWFCPATIETFKAIENTSCVEIKMAEKIVTLQAKLLVAADGVHSVTRKLAGIGIKQDDYQQSAVITNVKMDQLHQGIAFERFTDTGLLLFCR